jgi:hypothetical protein
VMRMRLEPFVSLTIVFASACSSRDLRIVAGTNDSLVVNVPRLLIVDSIRFPRLEPAQVSAQAARIRRRT